MKTLNDLSFKGKRVLVRCEFNIPLKEGRITDDRRIKASLPTIKRLLAEEPERLILLAHLGRPGGKRVAEYSLEPVAQRLSELLNEKVPLVTTYDRVPRERIILLENLRFYPGEERNDESFARKLAALGNAYVSEAFGVLHRVHASVDALPRLMKEKCAGLLVEKEVRNLDFTNPERPFVALIGAAKITDKAELLDALLEKVDKLLLGGAMIFLFYKALGYEVGKSLCDEERVGLAKRLLEWHATKIVLPSDVVISEDVEGHEIFTVAADKIPPGMKGLDIGDESVESFIKILQGAATVFWNGPLGVYEVPPFDHATNKIATSLAKMKAQIVAGGGDTAAAIYKLGLEQYYTHVSTGGGAALQLVAGRQLPGLAALDS